MTMRLLYIRLLQTASTDFHTLNFKPVIFTTQQHLQLTKCCSAIRTISTHGNGNINPLLELQPYLDVPIVPEDQISFDPSKREILHAEKMFIPSYKGDIRFVKGAYKPEELPLSNLPEVAFVGSSNVGKSSLLKALFTGVPDLMVKTSKTPGHTKLLVFFEVRKAFTLVDMPGYGFRMPENYENLVEEYLLKRKQLCRSFLLVDGVTGMTDTDKIAFGMMEQFKIPYCVVLTKIDKAGRHTLLKNIFGLRDHIVNNTHICLPQPFLISSVTGAGISMLQAFIAYVTGNQTTDDL